MTRSAFAVGLLAALLSAHAADPPDTGKPLTTRMREAHGTGTEAIALYRIGLADADPRVRAAAVQMYWADAGMPAFDDLAPLSTDPDPRVALAVILGMVPHRDPRVVEPIRKALRTAQDSSKAQIASAVGDARDARFVDDLGALLGERNVALRRVGVEAMRAIGRPECVPPLLKATGDADPRVASSAVAALGTIGDPKALPRIAQLAESKSPAVRAAVAEALPALGATGSHREVLVRLLGDPEPAVAMGVLRGIRDHYSPNARRVLEPAAASTDERIRKGAVLALDDAPAADLAALLPSLMRDRSPEVRASAVRRAGASRVDTLYDAVVARAADEDPTVRALVATALGDYGVERGAAVLALLASDVVADVRLSAVAAAARVPGETALAVLRKAVTDADEQVRSTTVRALADREEAEARALLRASANDKSPAVRAAAITELARVGDPAAAELVKRALSDPAEQVRFAAQGATTVLRRSATAPPPPR